MTYDFSQLKQKIKDTDEWLLNEYRAVRTGRATPVLLDSLQITVYGTRVPINQVANISIEDARTLRITPWDTSQIKEIEKAITDSNLGVSASSDEKGVRASFPELTAENRTALVKVVKEKLEHARISLRSERDEIWNDIQKQERDKIISTDDKFRYKDEMQKLIDEGGNKLEGIAFRKEKEITS